MFNDCPAERVCSALIVEPDAGVVTGKGVDVVVVVDDMVVVVRGPEFKLLVTVTKFDGRDVAPNPVAFRAETVK